MRSFWVVLIDEEDMELDELVESTRTSLVLDLLVGLAVVDDDRVFSEARRPSSALLMVGSLGLWAAWEGK